MRKINDIAYIDTKNDYKNTPILILHGWQQNKESWNDIIELMQDEYRVICPDLPGFGESKNRKFLDFGVDDYARYIEKFLKELGIKKINILAHSFGGRIAINMASQENSIIENLILFSSAGIIEKDKKINRVISSKSIKKIVPEKIKNKFKSRDYINAGELKNVFIKAINYNVKPLLKNVHCPTLIIWGDHDQELDISKSYLIQREIKDSEIVVLQGYTHFAHIENPYLFSGTVKKFLKKNEKI
jgi:pimeloyl-ACP methyl ester carboxylesterase